ncbi:MAG: SRPBCC domain-containing protein [Ferruginibacter sp.]
MTAPDFSTTISVDKTPKEAFDAINNVRGWWTENSEGHSEKINDEFEVRFGDVHYSKQKLIEVIPNEKVVWLVTDSKLNFLKDKTEWTDMTISFDIVKEDNRTIVRFTQSGLVPEIECYSACSNAWSDYINNSLRNLITTGKGQPSAKK